MVLSRLSIVVARSRRRVDILISFMRLARWLGSWTRLARSTFAPWRKCVYHRHLGTSRPFPEVVILLLTLIYEVIAAMSLVFLQAYTVAEEVSWAIAPVFMTGMLTHGEKTQATRQPLCA